VTYVVGILVAFVTLWIILVVALIAVRPKGLRVADAARMMPDLVRLIRGLVADHTIPRRIRARIWILLAWMISPIDLIPDVIPVLGMVDDVVLAYLVLRSVVRSCGDDVLARHWPGSPEGLAALEKLLGIDRTV